MAFRKDLLFGNKYEQELINVLKPENYKIMKGYHKEYDIEIYENNETILYEVKADRLAYTTNNLCIEYECNAKPSGITSTTADNYAYFITKPNDEYDLYIIPVAVIRDGITQTKYKRKMKGGNGYRSNFYLFDIGIYAEFLKAN